MGEGLYEVLEVLGRGSYATVCAARVRGNLAERVVALKVLHPEHIGNRGVYDRFRDEAWVLGKLRHRNIVAVTALHDYDGRLVMEMEAVRGVPLLRVLHNHRNGLPPGIVLTVGIQIAGALDYAFNAPVGPDRRPLRIVHRDVKPANIVLSETGETKLLDFGIAKADFDGRRAKSLYLVPGSQGFTPPERLEGTADSQATDVYALGVSMFTLLTGHQIVPYSTADKHADHVHRSLAHLTLPGLSGPRSGIVRDLLEQMTRFNAEDRPSCEEVVQILRGLLVDETLNTDLARFALREVVPLLPTARQESGIEPDDLSGLGFLEEQLPTPVHQRRSLTPQQAQARIAAFLTRPDWDSRHARLDSLLARCDAFPEREFLAVLDRADPPWWRFWVRRSSPAQVETALILLCDHPSPRVTERARRLVESSDPRVRTAARFVLNTCG